MMKVKIPITLYSDAKGYLDRECPNPNCQYTFKICGNRVLFQTSIEVQNKSGILQELKDLDITKSYLFPDLSSVGEEINARYPANQGKETLS